MVAADRCPIDHGVSRDQDNLGELTMRAVLRAISALVRATTRPPEPKLNSGKARQIRPSYNDTVGVTGSNPVPPTIF